MTTTNQKKITYQYLIGYTNTTPEDYILDISTNLYVPQHKTINKSIVKHEQHTSTWDELVDILKQPEYVYDKSVASMICMSTFNTNTTAEKTKYKTIAHTANNVEFINGIVLDYDKNIKWADLKPTISNYKYIAYSSFNNNKNGKDDERFRIIIPLITPITPTDFRIRKYKLEETFKGVDKTTFYVGRFFYVYSCGKEVTTNWCETNDGEEFDIYAIEPRKEEEFIELETSDELVNSFYDTIKTIKPNTLTYDGGFWKIYSFGNGIYADQVTMANLVYDKLNQAGNHVDISKQLGFAKTTTKTQNPTAFQNVVLANGGNLDNWIGNKGFNGEQKTILVERGDDKRKDLKDVEEEIFIGIKRWVEGNNVILSHDPGSGKTSKVLEVICEPGFVGNVNMHCYNKTNMEEAYDKTKDKINTQLVYGRDHKYENGEVNCKHKFGDIIRDKAQYLDSLNKKIKYERKYEDSDYDAVKVMAVNTWCNLNCEHINTCKYKQQYDNNEKLRISHHSFLVNEHKSTFDKNNEREVNYIIIDEGSSDDVAKIYETDIDYLYPITKHILSLFAAVYEQSEYPIEIKDSFNLIENIFNIKDQIKADEFNFDDLFSQQMSTNQSLFYKLGEEIKEMENKRKQFFSEIEKCNADLSKVKKVISTTTYPSGNQIKVSSILYQNLSDLFLKQQANYSIGVMTHKIGVKKVVNCYTRKLTEYIDDTLEIPKLLLDATVNPKYIKFKGEHYGSLSKWAEDLTVIQVKDKSFTKTSLQDPNTQQDLVNTLIGLLNNGHEKIGFVTYKNISDLISKNDIIMSNIKSGKLLIQHFGNTKGTNMFEVCDLLVVVGQYRENEISLYNKYVAYYNQVPDMSKTEMKKGIYQMKTGQWLQQTKGYKIYNDPLLQEMADIAEVAEMEQTFGRIRPSRINEPKTLLILGNRPQNIPVDELVTWGSLSNKAKVKREERNIKEEEMALNTIEKYLVNKDDILSGQNIKEILKMELSWGESKVKKIYYNIMPELEVKYEIIYKKTGANPQKLYTKAN